jgi:hypothetical protein
MLKKPNHKKITLYLDNNVLDLIKQVQEKINTQRAKAKHFQDFST